MAVSMGHAASHSMAGGGSLLSLGEVIIPARETAETLPKHSVEHQANVGHGVSPLAIGG